METKYKEKMTTQEYIEAGHCFETIGWIVTIDDSDPKCENLPVAVHKDIGQVWDLEYYDEDVDDWRQDWQATHLEDHWGDPSALIAELRKLYDAGHLRVKNAVHNLPGDNVDSLGAIIC